MMRAAMSDLFTTTQHTEFDLRHGDCVAGLAAIEAESVDVVVTSPPYNLGIAYSQFRDDAPREDYLDWCFRWASELRRVLKPAGSFFLNVGAAPANPLLPHELLLKLRPLFQLQNTIHWIKSITVQPRRAPEMSVGHFKPINSRRYLTDCHEYVFHLTKSGDVAVDRLAIGVEYADKTNIARWGHTGGRDRRCRGNNWFIPYKTINSRDDDRPHPATFPAQLAEWCLRLHGLDANITMLDPFLGLGHAAEAAAKCGVKKFIGFEINEGYLAEARARLAQ
ncbi:MAG TPA: site-specific DNA-methyltransferase [Chthoniobacteraceae bacterium]|nr:site-specific DNA-methyltransferase [Chthoniobacteraceae bacterium]